MELFLKEYLMKIAIHSRRTFLTRSLAAGTAFGLGGCPKPGSDGAADRAATADGHAELEGLFATWADALLAQQLTPFRSLYIAR